MFVNFNNQNTTYKALEWESIFTLGSAANCRDLSLAQNVVGIFEGIFTICRNFIAIFSIFSIFISKKEL